MDRQWPYRIFTLPFVVGADARARNSSASVEDARRILAEMQEYKNPKCSLVFLWCPDRGAPVVGLRWYTEANGRGLAIAESLKEKWQIDEEKIFEELAQLSEMRIREDHFSRVGQSPYADWAPFDRNDLEFIDSVIGKKE